MSLPEPETDNKRVAVAISRMNNNNTSHLIGVLLTILDASLPKGEQSESLKSLVKREMYNDQHERVSLIHSIISRAEIKSFKENPELNEQIDTQPYDHMVFDKYEK